MGKVTKIVTHHRYPEDAAEAWLRDRVCAIGFVYDPERIYDDAPTLREYMRMNTYKREGRIRTDTASYLRFRDQMETGDVVLAYVRKNTVGLVGVVEGGILFDDHNETGADFEYPNQRFVKWFESPRFFNRNLLPKSLREWVSRKGTILRTDCNLNELADSLSAAGGSSPEEIKATVSSRVGRHTDGAHHRNGTTEPRSTSKYPRSTKESETLVERRHNSLVNSFRLWIGNQGFEEIVLERDWVDIRFRRNRTRYMVEVKIAKGLSPRLCIREALGQVLEYNLYGWAVPTDKWIILLDRRPSDNDCRYVERLKTDYGLPLNLSWPLDRGFDFLEPVKG